MRKRLILWGFFTFLAGLLPLVFILYVCKITEREVTYQEICSEIFFFNIILSADGLKTLYDIKPERDLKLTLYAGTIFILLCVSVFYGTMLLNQYNVVQSTLNLEWIFSVSIIFSCFCILSCLAIQILGGIANE